MDVRTAILILMGVVAVLGIIWAGYRLDRRSQRIQATKWMRSWAIHTRVLSDLLQRWRGPLRLEHRRQAETPPEPGKPSFDPDPQSPSNVKADPS